MKKYGCKKGFTLIELIVVIAIIGVLAALLVPSMLGYVRKAKKSGDISSAKSIYMDARTTIADEGILYDAFYNDAATITATTSYAGQTESYNMSIVCKRDGNDTVGWIAAHDAAADFTNSLNTFQTSGKIPVKYKKADSGRTADHWYICYRTDDPTRVEIWVGDSSDPLYRIWPDADSRYTE